MFRLKVHWSLIVKNVTYIVTLNNTFVTDGTITIAFTNKTGDPQIYCIEILYGSPSVSTPVAIPVAKVPTKVPTKTPTGYYRSNQSSFQRSHQNTY
jgi:hypothetical protein